MCVHLCPYTLLLASMSQQMEMGKMMAGGREEDGHHLHSRAQEHSPAFHQHAGDDKQKKGEQCRQKEVEEMKGNEKQKLEA